MNITEPKSKESKVFRNSSQINNEISKIMQRVLQALKNWNNRQKKSVGCTRPEKRDQGCASRSSHPEVMYQGGRVNPRRAHAQESTPPSTRVSGVPPRRARSSQVSACPGAHAPPRHMLWSTHLGAHAPHGPIRAHVVPWSARALECTQHPGKCTQVRACPRARALEHVRRQDARVQERAHPMYVCLGKLACLVRTPKSVARTSQEYAPKRAHGISSAKTHIVTFY